MAGGLRAGVEVRGYNGVMIRRVLVLAFVLLSAPAFAQSTYVSGALGVDVSRLSHAESSLYASPSSGTEVLSGALRVGMSLNPIWGVELEFVRAGRSDDQAPNLRYATLAGNANAALPVPIDYRPDVRRRQMGVDAVAWVRKPVSGSVDLVYLGGVAFTRARSDITQQFIPQGRTTVLPAPVHSTFIEYATGPLVGIEARITMTARLRLVPGIRVQGLGDGWGVRPAVALGWSF